MALIKTNPGDSVKITLNDNHTEAGIIMPSSKEAVTIIKLSTGYNVGFENKDIKDLKLIKKAKESSKESKQSQVPKNKNLPKISILHTGGTIASKVDYKTGGVVALFEVEDLLRMVPELEKIANVKARLVSNMMSEDIRFSNYRKLTHAIKKEIREGCDGIIIGHGTDTLAITASALSFMCENLPVPVILVGSQRSSDRGSSDAAMNLISASKFISQTDFVGVGICMHEHADDDSCVILPATKTRKMHTSRRDAFKAINDSPIARISYPKGEISFLKDYNKLSERKGEVIFKEQMEDKVGLLKTHPNMFVDVFEVFRKKGYKGLVLEGTGIGQAPTNTPEHQAIYEELKNFIQEGGVVVLTSQCIYGAVHPFIYSNCRRLVEIGVIFGKDMLTETAHIKLSWLLANEADKDQVKELMQTNLRGEINEKIKYSEDFTN
ncbi:Glu-tRNA(Gln) amidotransferase subunit GatD [archaeon]|nr:Glu-tRNA(Gln) amidotransferase subunit GatD [archaeon]